MLNTHFLSKAIHSLHHYYLKSILLLIAAILLSTPVANAKRIFFAGYDGGFFIESEEEGGMALRVGGSFWADYRHYAESERADNRFDIRQGRLIFKGNLTRWFNFGMTYEFQGNETSNLLDAYGEAVFSPHFLRFGQFKAPFSLEWQTPEKAIYFAERAMGNALAPNREIGLMLHGGFFHDALHYSFGVFNGNGDDGSADKRRQDDPEWCGRLFVKPFTGMSSPLLNGMHFGISGTYARIDIQQVDLKVKSTGMIGLSRNIYLLSANSKFGVLQDAEARDRIGLEAAWAYGPIAFQAEYTDFTYHDLKPSGLPTRNADFSAYYAAFLWCLTGEKLYYQEGALKPVYPDAFFNPEDGTYGAFILGLRVEHFKGDPDWIIPDAFVSVEKADGVSLAVNWLLFPMTRIVCDVSHTRFSDPIRVQVHPDGRVDYIERENVLTIRFAMDF